MSLAYVLKSIFSYFYVIMCFFKNVTSELGDSMILTTFMEMLTNAQGQDIDMMVHEVGLNIVFYRFNYLIFFIILC